MRGGTAGWGEGWGMPARFGGRGPPTASFEQEEGGTTVTGQCGSHTPPRLRLLQPYEQYGAVCIPHAALFPLPLVDACPTSFPD